MSLPPVTVYCAVGAMLARRDDDCFKFRAAEFDKLFLQSDPAAWLHEKLESATPVLRFADLVQPFEDRQRSIEAWHWLMDSREIKLRAPIQSQEVWAAGVTYLRSRDARMDESKDGGGGSFYDRVYDAERPEIFFKATPHRVVAPGGRLTLRSDSRWNVPEPELALAINRDGRIFGYTVGNDMSSRDIEGENPLYLPQAKVWSACCGLGPGLVVREPLPRDTAIEIEIVRAGASAFRGETSLDRMKRTLPELAEFLFRDNTFPHGCYLLTGTGIVPPNDFTLASGDEVRIAIGGVGTLVNTIA